MLGGWAGLYEDYLSLFEIGGIDRWIEEKRLTKGFLVGLLRSRREKCALEDVELEKLERRILKTRYEEYLKFIGS